MVYLIKCFISYFYKYNNFYKKNIIFVIVYSKKNYQNLLIYRYLFIIITKIILKYFKKI